MKCSFAVVCLLFLTTVVSESNAATSSFSTCALCKAATDKLKQGLEDESLAIYKIGEILDGYCDKLSGAAAKSCYDFVDKLTGLYVYACSADSSSLDDFCERTMQCPVDKSQPGSSQTKCETCLKTIKKMIAKLAGDASVSSGRVVAEFCSGSETIEKKVECVRKTSHCMETEYAKTVESLKPVSYCKTTGNCLKSVT